jgi:hypothetical protein
MVSYFKVLYRKSEENGENSIRILDSGRSFNQIPIDMSDALLQLNQFDIDYIVHQKIKLQNTLDMENV